MAFRSGFDAEHVTDEVRRLVRPADQEAAVALLNQVRGDEWDVVWLRLAVLNLAAGRLDLLPQWVEMANRDGRDLKMATLHHLDPMWDAKYRWPAEKSPPPGR